MSYIEIDDVAGKVVWVRNGYSANLSNDDGSYVATIEVRLNGRMTQIAAKSFGNGVRAEDWILEEMSLPKSLLLLKYNLDSRPIFS